MKLKMLKNRKFLGKNDDLVTSLGVAVYGMQSLMGTTPMEYSQGEKKDPKLLLPSINNKVRLQSFGGITEEDIKWLMK